MPIRGRVGAGLAAAGAAALAAWIGWFAPRRLVVRRRTLRLPHWPAELDGLRVVVLADLHAGAPQVGPAKVREVAAEVNRARPELVLMLGDFVDENVALGEPVAPEAVAAGLGAVEAPLGTFAVLGNQDWETGGDRVGRAMEGAGVRVLENDVAAVTRRDRRLWIAGLADEHRRRADLDGTLGRVPAGEPVILIAHSPDVFPRVPARVSLTLAGHTHAGQVNVPILRRRVVPSRYGARYASGHVEEEGRHLFVHPGIGTSRWPVRFAAPPEVTVLTLRSAR